MLNKASMRDYHGASIAQRGVIYVSFNYRLGAFGFLDHPEAGGNAAVQDWVAALDWVSRNITAFGGDPANVTVFGQSSGAEAVRTLLATPTAQGLFHRAILQSAGFERPAASRGSARERVVEASARLFEQLGGSDLEHLRRVPADQVRQASRLLSGAMPPPGAVDPARLYTPATLAKMATVLGGDRAEHIVAQLTGNPYEALAELFTAAIWTEPALASYRRFTGLGRTTYSYRFVRVSPGNRRTGMLAFHCSELPYLFGHLVPAEDYDEMDTRVSDTIGHAWTEFARTGVPSSPDGTPWPAATRTAPRLTAIDDEAHSRPLDLSPATELINSIRVGAEDRTETAI